MARLIAVSRTLSRRKAPGKALPFLFAVTDPERTPDPVRLAELLPRGAGLIYRAFGAAQAPELARRLARIAARRGLVLLIGAGEPRLARYGVHLPERMAGKARRFKAPGRLVTAAAHGAAAIRRARLAGADAVLISPVFESASPSAGRPLGRLRFRALVLGAGLPVYALGGVDAKTAPQLLGSGAAGLAAVGAFARK